MPDENTNAAPEVDLFGAPVTQIRERWGRPSFSKTKENQRVVATLRLAGWAQAHIAAYIGTTEKTLRKNFSRELQAGADLIEGQALEVLVAKMRQGNLTAARRILDLAQAGRAAPPIPKDEADGPRGKKEILTDAANKPGATWGNLLQ